MTEAHGDATSRGAATVSQDVGDLTRIETVAILESASVKVPASLVETAERETTLSWFPGIERLARDEDSVESASDKLPTCLVETAEMERESVVSSFCGFERLDRIEEAAVPEECGVPSSAEADDMGCPERVFVGFETPSSGAPGELPGIGVRVCSLEKEYTATIGFSFFGEVSISEVRCVYDEACGGNMSRAESLRIKSH